MLFPLANSHDAFREQMWLERHSSEKQLDGCVRYFLLDHIYASDSTCFSSVNSKLLKLQGRLVRDV